MRTPLIGGPVANIVKGPGLASLQGAHFSPALALHALLDKWPLAATLEPIATKVSDIQLKGQPTFGPLRTSLKGMLERG